MRSKELWLVQENHATVKLDSSVASRGMKAYSENRIEMRKLQILFVWYPQMDQKVCSNMVKKDQLCAIAHKERN